MTLADLLTTLDTRGTLPASRVKDCKTSLRYLAQALGQSTPEECPLDSCRDPTTWTVALETHFQAIEAQGRTISAATRRNTRNNLRVIFRLAAAHSLLDKPLPQRLLTKPKRVDFQHQQWATAPYQTTYHPQTGPRYFGLPQAEWPPDIQAGWQTYRAKCGLRLRETTLRNYAKHLATYFGYLAHICGRSPRWDDLFEVTTLAEFLRWQGARHKRPLIANGHLAVRIIAAMAVVLEHPARQALADFRNGLPTPAALHTKRAHWVSLATLEAVAEACLAEGRSAYLNHGGTQYPGARRASHFQRGLMLKILVRIPLRQRNLRELRLEHNLYEDEGHWQLHFRGDELKIDTRGGQVNEYRVDLTDYCPDLLPALQEFLQVHRPRLPGHAASQSLFLTKRGNPFTQEGLYRELADTVAMRTGQRFYPHLVRSVWATEYIEKTRDFTGAAYMLGDTVATVLRAYQHILGKDQQAKAKAFLGTALRTG
jgi:hypothetical protein